MRTYKHFYAVFLIFLISCTDSGIANYKGDGQIVKLKAPLMGVSGYSIKLTDFDLSKGLNREFQLTGLPPMRALYNIYIVVNDSQMKPEVLLGEVRIAINNDGKISRFESTIKDMTNNAVADENRFYFYDVYELNLLHPRGLNTSLSITVNCENKYLQTPAYAKLVVRGGGSK